ncbi:response regulator receiver protein [Nostoc sp. CENA543]|uniref:response regulator n=1 Tax=Nostoc sp. CENA543 TaxID=1869241 RepID=UPI000CA13897|nr:response regulator [Nostoc sp. CENA543]AUT03517.1 response regulator receiver protein [Nostoc sp. CENA543]
MKILCIEDDVNLVLMLKAVLVNQGYQVDLAEDGEAGWQLAQKYSYNLIILDLLLPKIDGMHLCKLLRSNDSIDVQHNRNTPVMLMTALDTVTNKVTGLDVGADDYIVKPFNMDEFLARIRVLLRRSGNQISACLNWGELCLNPNTCEVSYAGQPIHLFKKEYEILEMFLRHPQQIFSHNLLLDSLWEADEIPTHGALRAHIKGIRNKLKKAGANNIFETVYKLGYRLKPLAVANASQITITTPKKQFLPISISPTDSLIPELRELWHQSRQSYQERLLIIQKAVTALVAGKLTPEQQHEAEREAHTLIGSLGSFGLDKSSDICRQIQQILQQAHLLGKPKAEELKLLVAQLQHCIEMDAPNILGLNNSLVSHLLIIDNDIGLAKDIATEGINRGFNVNIATNSEQAEQILVSGAIDVILLNLDYQNNLEIGLSFLAKIRSQYSQIPVVIITQADSFATRLEVARLRISYFLIKPISSSQVVALLTQVLHQNHPPLYRLLVVDDDPGILQLVYQILSPYGYQVTLLDQPLQFWETLEQTNPDLLILDIELLTPEKGDNTRKLSVNGFDLCQIIRNDWQWNRLPILFLSAHTDVETIQHSFAVGANDFLSKPIVAKELQARIRTRLEQQANWKLTEVDELTGLSIRSKALKNLTKLLQQAQSQQQTLSLAMLDIDFFKLINDKYGHPTGDRVLSYFGQLLNQSFCQQGVIGRWGGEEFVIGMCGVTAKASCELLTQILQKLRQHSFTTDREISFQITFSAGVAEFPGDGQDIQALLQAADAALYKAKQQGRSLVLLATDNYTK